MSLNNLLLLSGLLFSVGCYGVLARRNLVGILLSLELMLNAAVINFIAFAKYRANVPDSGQVFSLFIIAISACEMAVALAILVSAYRKNQIIDVLDLTELHDDYSDEEQDVGSEKSILKEEKH